MCHRNLAVVFPDNGWSGFEPIEIVKGDGSVAGGYQGTTRGSGPIDDLGFQHTEKMCLAAAQRQLVDRDRSAAFFETNDNSFPIQHEESTRGILAK